MNHTPSIRKQALNTLMSQVVWELVGAGISGLVIGLLMYLTFLAQQRPVTLWVIPSMGIALLGIMFVYALITAPGRYRRFYASQMQLQHIDAFLGTNPLPIRNSPLYQDGALLGINLVLQSTQNHWVFWSGVYHLEARQPRPHYHLATQHPQFGTITANYLLPAFIKSKPDDPDPIRSTRCEATIVAASAQPALVNHVVGIPPGLQDTLCSPSPQLLPWPRVLVLRERPDGVFLERWTATGAYAGDTWHASVDQAYQQAQYEYGDALGAWQAVPVDVQDVVQWLHHQQRTR